MLETIHLSTAVLTGAYALQNRLGNFRKKIKNKFPKISKAYEKISPTIEHFCYGYAITALGNTIQETETLKEFILNYEPNSPVENYGLIAGGFATALDFGWELNQNLERKKFQPAQFLGTCAGVLTSIAINNLEKILK